MKWNTQNIYSHCYCCHDCQLLIWDSISFFFSFVFSMRLFLAQSQQCKYLHCINLNVRPWLRCRTCGCFCAGISWGKNPLWKQKSVPDCACGPLFVDLMALMVFERSSKQNLSDGNIRSTWGIMIIKLNLCQFMYTGSVQYLSGKEEKQLSVVQAAQCQALQK